MTRDDGWTRLGDAAVQPIAEHLAQLLLDDPVLGPAMARGGPDTPHRLVDHALACCLARPPVEPAPQVRLRRLGVVRLVRHAESALSRGGVPVRVFLHGLADLEAAAQTWRGPSRWRIWRRS